MTTDHDVTALIQKAAIYLEKAPQGDFNHADAYELIESLVAVLEAQLRELKL